MIKCQELYEIFRKNNLTFFVGVPDSTFKEWMSFLNDYHGQGLTNIVAGIEREAIGWASGYYTATRKIGVAYMQNSGLGNVVNPITSLADKEVYSIPIFLMIGWRGEPGQKDEPQHKKMGRIMLPLLDVLEIPYKTLPADLEEAEKTISSLKETAENESKPVALIVKSGTLEDYISKKEAEKYEMTRETAIETIANSLNESDIIVSTTGKCSRELFEYRERLKQGHNKEFLMVGSMGLASSFASSISLEKPNRRVYVLDGDGAAIMSAETLATIGHYKPNLNHIILDNSSHDSTGGQPTVSSTINFEQVALGFGYNGASSVSKKEDLIEVLKQLREKKGPQMLIVKVKKGARKDLGRPTTTPIQNKQAFMDFLKD